MSIPSFFFRTAATSRGLIASGEGSTEFFHPLLPFTLFGASGLCLILNGYNLNRSMSDSTGYDGTTATAVQLLQMRAPREPVAPLVSAVGTGRVFRPGAKYRYRWYNSRTGEFSGLSPIPSTVLNLGVETPVGSQTVLGVTCYFYFPTSAKPAQADTIQLFANVTNEDDVWFLADEAPTGTATYISLVDNNTDEELYLKLAVVTGVRSAIPAGPTWNQGVMWPIAKAWQHPNGSVYYYGMRRFGRVGFTGNRVSVTQGSDLVTIQNDISSTLYIIEPGRVGQRLNLFPTVDQNDPSEDPTVYRIVKTESATTFRVTPELQISNDLAEGTTANFYYQIEDDRDARYTFVAEPGRPWLIDPLKTLAAGDDYDDGVMGWFSIDGRIFMQTKRRIYEALGGASDDPTASTLFIPVSDKGTPGLWSGVETPFGYVFLHETMGICIFNGGTVIPFSGNDDPFAKFGPLSQFRNFEQSMFEEVRLAYDDDTKKVLVSYVPSEGSALRETLEFSTEDRNWRGPNRTRLFSAGRMRSAATADTFVYGDDQGGLLVREAQALECQANSNGASHVGTIASIQSTRLVTNTGTDDLNLDGDERLRGAPIWFLNASGVYFFARITDILSSTQFEIDGPPVDEDGTLGTIAVGWTYGIGSLRWSLLTAYLDSFGDPALNHEFLKLDLRFRRGAGSEVFEAAASKDGSTTFAGVRLSSSSAASDTRDVNGKVHGQLRLKASGCAVIQLRLRGISRIGEPQISRAVLIAEEKEGALPD